MKILLVNGSPPQHGCTYTALDEAARAQRVVVMSDGHVAMEGTPREVFARVDEIKDLALLPPQTIDLLHQLRKAGYDLPLDALSVEECADVLEAFLR